MKYISFCMTLSLMTFSTIYSCENNTPIHGDNFAKIYTFNDILKQSNEHIETILKEYEGKILPKFIKKLRIVQEINNNTSQKIIIKPSKVDQEISSHIQLYAALLECLTKKYNQISYGQQSREFILTKLNMLIELNNNDTNSPKKARL